MTNNILYFPGCKKKEPAKTKKPRGLKCKTIYNNAMETNPKGMFIMTWDKYGDKHFWCTHGRPKKDFVRMALYDFITGGLFNDD